MATAFGNRAAYYDRAVDETLQRVRNSDLSIWEKSRIGGRINSLRNQPEPSNRISFGRMVGTLRDAGFGAAPAYLGSRLLGLPKPLHYAAVAGGATLGAVMGNLHKNGSYADEETDRENAYRMGFLHRASAKGYFEKDAALVIPVNPGDIAAVPQGISRSVRSGASNVGSILGRALGPEQTDARLAELQLEEEMLRERLRELMEQREDRAVSRVLQRRRS